MKRIPEIEQKSAIEILDKSEKLITRLNKEID